MKVIIAGSRKITNYAALCEAVGQSGYEVTEVVSGRAGGVDRLGERWAREHGIPVKYFPADWQAHGNRAGVLRNAEMAAYADAAVLLWDGKSRGTSDMRTRMIVVRKPFYRVILPQLIPSAWTP